MKLGKRTLALGLALVTGGLTLTAVAQSKAQMEFWTVNLQTFADFYNPLVESYQKTNPNVSLKWVDVAFNAFQQKTLASVAAGNPPDAVQLNKSAVAELAEQGALLPLNDLLDAKTLALYQPAALSAFTVDGKVYALPDYATPRIIAYNADILKKAGIDANNLPKTIPGINALAKTIKDKTGLYGYIPNIGATSILQVFQEAGLAVTDKSGKAVFNTPEHVAVLQEYVDMRKKDYLPEDTMRRGFAGAYELYAAGKLGFMIIGPTFIPRLEKDNNALWKNTIIRAHPVGLGNVVQASTFAWSVPKGVKDPKAAARLAAFLTSDATQLAFSKRTGTTFPTTVKAAKDPFFTTGGNTTNDAARLATAQTTRYAKELTVTASSSQGNAVKDNIEAAFFGRKTAKQALDDAVKAWNAAR
jgi:putative chitobiose transport system substrate-binding protein